MMGKICRFDLTPQELRELRQLVDLETEEAIWTRFQLSPDEAHILAR